MKWRQEVWGVLWRKDLSELYNAVSKKQLIHFSNPDVMSFKLLSLDNDISSLPPPLPAPITLALCYGLGENRETAELRRKSKQCSVITWTNVSLTGMTFLVYRIFQKSRRHNMYWSSMQLKSILCREIDFLLWYFCIAGVNAEYNLHPINGIVHHQMKNIFNITAVSSCLKP